MNNAIAVDFETFYDTKNGYSVGKVKGFPGLSVWSYIHDPRFSAYWVAMYGADLRYSGPVDKAPWDKLVGRPLISHNASFDHTILEHLQETSIIPQLRIPSMYDTADAVAYFQEPRNLQGAAKMLLGVEHSKAVRSSMDGRPFSTLGVDEVAALERYGGADAELCWKLWEKTHEKWPLTEQRVSSLNRLRGQQGIHLDAERLQAAINELDVAHFNLLKAMPWTLTGGKPLSMECIREQGRSDGIPVPATLKMDDPGAILWEKTYSKDFRWVAAVRGYRRINALVLKLKKWQRDIRPDGTAPFSLKYFGAAATGRFSGSGGFNLQNLPRKPAVLCKSCFNCQLEDPDEECPIDDEYNVEDPCPVCGAETRFVIDVRSMIVAPPGRCFVIADYSQIEARLLLWRVKDEDTLKLIRGGFHIYEAYARRNMGFEGLPGTLKKIDGDKYSAAKASVLGGGYGAGKVGFARSTKQFTGKILTPEESQASVDAYRSSNQKVVAHWRWHEDWFRVSAIAGDPEHNVRLPNGHLIRYFEPRFHLKTDKEGRTRQELIAEVVHGARGGKGTRGQTRTFFGGKLTENEMQATAAFVMRDGWLAAEDAGAQVHFTVHDELVASTSAQDAKEAVEQFKEKLPAATNWVPGCPLAVDVFSSERYSKKG